MLSLLLGQGYEFALSYLKERDFNQIDQNANVDYSIDRNFYHSIACNELTSTGIIEPKIEGDYFKIHKPTEGSCHGHSLKRPFDSKNYLISKPIYYILGFQDPWTSPKSYLYHIKNQTLSTKKISLCDYEHGHEVVTLLTNKCKQNLFEFIINETPLIRDNCPTIAEIANNVPCYPFYESMYSESNNQSIGGKY